MKFYNSRKSLKISITSVFLAFFLLFVMAGNNSIKNQLNRVFFDSLISDNYRQIETIVPDYFSYLQNTAFWIEAGNYPDITENNADFELLRHGALLPLPGVTALNYRKGDTNTVIKLKDSKISVAQFKHKENSIQRYLVEKKKQAGN